VPHPYRPTQSKIRALSWAALCFGHKERAEATTFSLTGPNSGNEDRKGQDTTDIGKSPYPPQILGAWGGWDTDPAAARQACESFKKNRKAVAGDLIIFAANRKHSFGGYADYSDLNVSVKQAGPNKWQIVDRHYQDEEGGRRAGYRNVAYEVILDGNNLTLKEGKYSSRFTRCEVTQAKPSEPRADRTQSGH
jgi:hypothetical protein